MLDDSLNTSESEQRDSDSNDSLLDFSTDLFQEAADDSSLFCS